MDHPLENVIWQALTTRQAHFAEAYGEARRFMREVTLLSAFREPSDEGYQSLADLVGANGTAAVFLDEPYQELKGWEVVATAPLLQMVSQDDGTASNISLPHEIIELGPPDSAEMIQLTSLTKPGPFGKRTHELGNYVGIRKDGKLVAMSGQRLQVPDYTEVSAVCTHPEHTGNGYAAALMLEVMRRIRERGETPFLHVRGDNARAIALYERLGFRTRKRGHFAVLRKI
ncbi:MAG TPA: GNAT family N-acetyltransferase [Candidatus Sulfotelmatobacter sp.]|nr:GNAT family N-acetyltransferase [Candidatus Sulfotelmatobacter sp.]